MLQLIKLSHLRFWLSLLTVFLLAGCVSRSSGLMSVNKLALAELNPQLRFEQEVMIVRLSQVLQEAKLNKTERADLYFERGVLYDSLGLWSLARFDFTQAVELQPKMAAAYNYLGLYLLLEGDYDSAIDAFNAVLELDPNYDYSYLNRGLAFYYGGRYTKAEADFLHFYEQDKQDPYRALWLYFNELELKNIDAKSNLIQRADGLSDQVWGSKIIAYFLGHLSLDQLRANIEAEAQPTTARFAEMLTETYFYLAKQKLKLNQVEEATAFFRLALANQVFNFVEYRFALFELSQLRNQTAPVVVGKN